MRKEVSKAIAQIGDESSPSLLLRLLAVDISSPGVHLQSISNLADRFPEQRESVIEKRRRFEADCPAVADAIAEIWQAGRNNP